MKKKITLLMLAALMAVTGVYAGTRTVRKYLRLTDSNLTDYWNENSRVSFDIPSNTVTAADINEIDNHGNGNIAVGWDFSSNKIIGNYTRLVINVTSQTNTNGLNIMLGEDGYWTGAKQSLTSFASDATHLEITLNTLIHNVSGGDSASLSLSDVNMICLVTQHQTADAMSFTLGEVYLEKDVDDATYYDYTTTPFDFTDLTYVQADNTSFNTDTYTFSFTGGSYGGWQWETPQDWSAYKYLVVVPQNQWNTGSIFCSYVLEDNASHVIDDAVLRWGEWNMARAAVLDLTTVKTTYFESGKVDNVDTYMDFDIKNITKFYFRPIWGASGDFGVAAVYLTNTAPIFGDNHDAASGTANYRREYTSKDKWGTICLPYNAAVCGAEVYEVVGVDDFDNPSKLYLQQVKYMMEAGKSYIFVNTQDEANSFHLSNVTFYQVGEYETNTPKGNNLIGTFTGRSVPNDGTCYILKDGSWMKVTGDNAKIAANRAYLKLTDNLEIPAEARRYIVMSFDETETTGIKQVNHMTASPADNYTYDLQGRKLMNGQLKKGIYIQNGKKIYVKK